MVNIVIHFPLIFVAASSLMTLVKNFKLQSQGPTFQPHKIIPFSNI